MIIINVTEEYLNCAYCNKSIAYDAGYSVERHADEVSVAKWLYDTFGGTICLLNESNFDGVKMPDYIWNGKMWELKTVFSPNNSDKLLQHAIKQIKQNPGGVILNLQKDVFIEKIEKQAVRRVARSHINALDLMFIKKKSLIKVIRYKK